MPNRGVVAGKKIGKSHHTVIPDAEAFVVQTKALPCVSKISIGLIEPCGVGDTRTLIRMDQHSVKVKVRGKTAVQTFYVYGSDLKFVLSELQKLFGEA